MDLKPNGEWILVRIDPFPETKNGVIILEDTTTNKVRTGTVLAVGPGNRAKDTGERIPVRLEKGEKVAFLRWNLEHQNGKRLLAFLEGFGDDLGLIKARDVLFAFHEGTEINFQ